MNEFLSIVINIFDIIISFFYSTYRIIVNYWSGMLTWVFIIIAFLLIKRLIKATRARTSFVKTVKNAAEEAGATLTKKRSPITSLFFNRKGYDLELSYGGILYRIKFFPGFIGGRAIHVETASDALKMSRISSAIALNGGKLRGRKKLLDYDTSIKEDTINILAFAPRPHLITTRSESGAVWEFGFDGADDVDGVYLFPSDLLAKQLVRVMEGYISTPVGRRQ